MRGDWDFAIHTIRGPGVTIKLNQAMAVGAASGAAAGKVSDVGVDDNFMRSSARRSRRGSAHLRDALDMSAAQV